MIKGIHHVALEVTDIEAEHLRLSEAGVMFAGPPVALGSGTFAIYGRDPFGHLIELYQTEAA